MKQNNSNKKLHTKTITTAAIFSALGVVFLYIGSVFEFLDLTAAGIASLIIILAVIERGGSVPWLIYAVTSLLSALLLPNKYPALLYIFFAGLYPMVKSWAERCPRIVSWVIKLVFFNVVLTVILFLAKNLLHIPEDALMLEKGMYLICNLMLIVFDYMLTLLITFYHQKLQRHFRLSGLFGK